MSVIYADQLREGDFAYLHGDWVQLKHVTIVPDVDLVFLVGTEILGDRVIVPSPFTLANLVEVLDVG